MIKKIIISIIVSGMLISCAGTQDTGGYSSGTFRGKWWNYYDRGLFYAGKADWEGAITEIGQAISMRDKDQRMARTYGMHFIDYFPHRELGIAYLNTGEINTALTELELSLRQEESAKAVYYLNRTRRLLLQRQTDRSFLPPVIAIETPAGGSAVSGLRVTVRGSVAGEGFVSGIVINKAPYRFDLAREHISFQRDITVDEGENEIMITAIDLLGNISRKTVPLTVDREGPMINIFDILPTEKDGKAHARITGEIYDGTGIKDAVINGKAVSPGGLKVYEFDITAERGATFNIRPEPVMLAFFGEEIFSSDEKPPIIDLKETGDIPSVFVEKYYVEGEVSDNKKVEKILINNKEMETRKGRKIFFSKLVGLKEGENRIDVNASDSAGNMTASGFTVKREVPAILSTGSRMSISILPFEDKQMNTALNQLAYEQLIGAFVEQKRFSVIERTRLEQVLLEQKLTREELTDPKNSIKVGRIIAAEGVMATSMRETPESIGVVSRVINTETSEVMEVKDVYSEDKSFSAVKDLMEGLASKIAGSFPVVEGMVIKKDNETVYSDIGSGSMIKKNTGAIMYRRGMEIKHPVTGRSLGFDTEKLGEGNIEEVYEDFSKIRLDDDSDSGKIEIQDLIITK
jgi:hypothetical protein